MFRTHVRFAITVLFCCFQTAFAENHNIVTVAGTGSVAEGGPATAAHLIYPLDITFDPLGNLYIADGRDNRIRKVDTSGFITTVVGNGIFGFSGDGGPATAAALSLPVGITFDPLGNLYIVDRDNQRIRKVDTSGFITTVAGNGTLGFSGDGGPATAALLNNPRSITFDPLGNLYIADGDNQRIRKVDTHGFITTVAGNGIFGFSGDGGPATAAKLNRPEGISVDALGNLFIADPGNNRVRKVDTSGIITTVAGDGNGGFSGDGGPATAAKLNGPVDVSVDLLGNLFICEPGFSGFILNSPGSNRIRKVDTWGIITTVAGDGNWGFSGDGGPATAAKLRSPEGVSIDPLGNLYIADSFNQRIRKVDTSGFITTVAGGGNQGFSGDGGPATAARLSSPVDVSFDPLGNLYIADAGDSQIRKVDTSGLITTVAGTGVFSSVGDGGLATAAALNFPWGITFDPLGNLFIADTYNFRIRKVDASGFIVFFFGLGLSRPTNITFDALGNLYIADGPSSRIRKVDTLGIVTTVAGTGIAGFSGDGGPANAAKLSSPVGVSVDPLGNLYIADVGNNRVRKVDTFGFITTVAGNGIAGFSGDGGRAIEAQLSSPSDISVDPLGNLYIADTNNQRIRKVDTYGFIATAAGNGTLGFSGDGGPATAAQLGVPRGITFDQSGNLYIADRNSNRIRRLNVATPINLDPDTLASKSNGKWVTASMEFPSGRDPNDVNLGSVTIQAIDPKSGEVRHSLKRPAGSPTELIDTDKNHVPDQLMVKFDRSTIASWVTGDPELMLRVEGQFNNGLYFSGDTSIRVSDSQ